MLSTMRLIGLVASVATAVALASDVAVAHTPRRLNASAVMSDTTIHVHFHHNHHQRSHDENNDKSGRRPTQSADGSCSMPANDTDYPGNNLKNVPGRQVGQCCGECANTPGCTAWSHNSDNGGTCWLKSSKGDVVHKQGVVSATMSGDSPSQPASGPATAHPFQPAQCNHETNVDYQGNDLKNVQGRQVDQCCGECASTNGCNAWSWNSDNGGTCWLKWGKGNAVPKHGVTSATIAPGGSPSGLGRCQVEKDTDYPGFDFKNVQGRQVDQCCGECEKTNGCNAWSWNSDNGGTCWLKYGKGNAVPKQGVMSAVM